MKKLVIGFVSLGALSAMTGCSTAIHQGSTNTPSAKGSTILSSESPHTSSQSKLRASSNTTGKVNTVKAVVTQNSQADDTVQCQTFVDPLHGWLALGHDILATSDGGKTWNQVSSATDSVKDIGFFSTKGGWLFAGKSLKVSDDGGRTWHVETVPLAPGINLQQAQFINAEDGWIMGTGQGKFIPDPKQPGSGTIPSIMVFWSTTDGGKTWTRMNVPTAIEKHEFDGACSFDFVSQEQGFLLMGSEPGAGQQGKSLYQTEDGGRQWEKVTSTGFNASGPKNGLPGGGYISGVDFLNNKVGWLSEERGPMYRTTDGGRTWKAVSSPSSLQNLSDIHFLNSETGCGVYRNALLMTQNGGATWKKVYPGLWPALFTSTQFFTAQDGVSAGTLVDPRAILRTADGGFTWQQIGSLPRKGQIMALSFPDPEHGWVITSAFSGTAVKRTLYQTTDGGRTWRAVHSTTAEKSLYTYVSFVNSQTGFLESGWGHLFVTHDGGKTLSAVSSEDSGAADVQFIRSKNGWEILNHYLYSTSDAGQTWQKIPLNDMAINFDIVNAKTIWMIARSDFQSGSASNTKLLSTKNGGQSWIAHDLGNIHASDVVFADPTHGWLVDEHGQYFHTNDGGQTWMQVDLLTH